MTRWAKLDARLKSVADFAKEIKGLMTDAASTAAGFSRDAERIALNALPDGPQKDRMLVEFDIKTEAKAAQEALRKQFEDLTKGPREEIGKLQEDLRKLMNNPAPQRKTFMTGGGGVGGTSGMVQESDAEFNKRVAEFESAQSKVRTEIQKFQTLIEKSRTEILGANNSAIDAIENAALDKLKAALSEIDKRQADIAQAATESIFNKQVEQWADKLNAAKEAAKSLREELKNPGQKMADYIRQLDDLLQRNLITQNEYSRAVKNREKELASEIQIAAPREIRLQFATVSDAGIGTAATDAMATQIASAVGSVIDTNVEKQQLEQLKKLLQQAMETNQKLKVGDSN